MGSRLWVGLLLLGPGCAGSAMPPTAPFELPPTRFDRWEDVLAEGATVRLESLVTGRQRYTLGDAVPDIEADRRDEPIEILVLAHLVHHPDHGTWLIDTGLGRAFLDEPYGDLRGLGVRVALAPFEQQEGEALGDRLEAAGVDPVGVFFTHLHLDHTAGAPDLPGDLRFVAALGEEPTSVPGLVGHDHLAHVDLLEQVDLEALPLVDTQPAADLFGDGSLWALPTPGHSPGHCSFLALTEPVPTLLTGDASHVSEGWEASLAPGFSDDPEQALDSLEALHALWETLERPALVFGHAL